MRITGPDPTPLIDVQNAVRAAIPEGEAPVALTASAFYYRHAPARNLRWSWAFAQMLLESDWGRSEVVTRRLNMAGIKVPATGEYRRYQTLEDGVIDHLDLLGVYTGLWLPQLHDPTRNTRLADSIHQRLGGYVTHSHHLNGIWAVPGDRYGQNIDRVWLTLVHSN